MFCASLVQGDGLEMVRNRVKDWWCIFLNCHSMESKEYLSLLLALGFQTSLQVRQDNIFLYSYIIQIRGPSLIQVKIHMSM